MKRCLLFFGVSLIALLAVSCSEEAAKPSSPSDKIRVFVSILPEAYLVNRIGGEYVKTGVMVPAGQDPHNYAPNPERIMELGKASIYFETGMPFEKSIVDKIKGGSSKIRFVNLADGIKRRKMICESESCGHKEEGDDPHIWNSIPNLEIMSANICRTLVKADPARAKVFEANLSKLEKDLRSLDEKIKKLLESYKGRSFFVFHPAFGYLADSYGLKQRAVEIEGKSPTPKQITELIKKARKDKVKIIFVEPQFNPKSAEVVASAIDGAVVQLNPLPENPLTNFVEMAEKLKKAFSQNKAPLKK